MPTVSCRRLATRLGRMAPTAATCSHDSNSSSGSRDGMLSGRQQADAPLRWHGADTQPAMPGRGITGSADNETACGKKDATAGGRDRGGRGRTGSRTVEDKRSDRTNGRTGRGGGARRECRSAARAGAEKAAGGWLRCCDEQKLGKTSHETAVVNCTQALWVPGRAGT